MSELNDIFGPATRYSMPEVRAAFTNGVSEIFISRSRPGRGQKASIDLIDDDGEKKITLIVRAEGAWGNDLSVQVTQVKTLSGDGVKYVNLDIFQDGQPIGESYKNLVLDEEDPNYFFDRINQQSRVVVAVDTLFQTSLPSTIAKTPLTNSDARPGIATLKAGATDVVQVASKRTGTRGNQTAIRVSDGQAGAFLKGAANAPSVDIQARQSGADGTKIKVSVVAAGPTTFNTVISPATGSPRTLGPFTTVDDIVQGLKNDPDVVAVAKVTAGSGTASRPIRRKLKPPSLWMMPKGRANWSLESARWNGKLLLNGRKKAHPPACYIRRRETGCVSCAKRLRSNGNVAPKCISPAKLGATRVIRAWCIRTTRPRWKRWQSVAGRL